MMNSRRALATAASLTVLSLAMILVFAGAGHAAATRTWVSGVGDDANPCSRTAPCKTFAGAISKTEVHGEINAIDAGGFGAVTITKPITIDTTNVLGGILNAGTSGVIVNITAPYEHPNVVLRGLDIYGAGSAPGTGACPWSGLNGVRVLSAGSVRIENSNIRNVSGNGVDIAPTLLDTKVLLDDVRISNACGKGVRVAPGVGHTATALVDDSSISTSGVGIHAAAGGSVRVVRSSVFDNVLGVEAAGGSVELSTSVTMFGNDADGTPTRIYDAIAAGPTGPVGPAGPSGVAGPSGANAPAPTKLVAVLGSAATSGAKGKKVALQYASTAAGAATLTVRKGSALVAIVGASAKSGKNTITWNGKAGSKAAAGAYKVTLSVTGSGQTSSDTAVVTLK